MPASTLTRLNPSASTVFSNNASTSFFPNNFFESTTPETFLELDLAGFFTHNSNPSSATKRRHTSSGCRRAPSSRIAMSGCCLEPSREPCTDEIPWSDLVFWLGNVATGELVCSCTQCTQQVMREYSVSLMRQQRYSPYEQQQRQQRRQVSSRVPVINMPKIEGVN